VGFLRQSGRAFQTVGPETENDREPMDSLTDGTASLLRYDDRRRQLYLLCVIEVHSSVRYDGARPFRQRWTTSMNYELTTDQELADAAAYALGDVACAVTRWQHSFAWNDVMAVIVKVWQHIRNPTLSIDAYLLDEQIASRSDLKRWSLRLFWRAHPNRNNKM